MGTVGVAPGTTTIAIGPTAPSLGRWDGGPTDFDMAKVYGYLPYEQGWLVGKLVNDGLGCADCDGNCAAGMGAPFGAADVSISTLWLAFLAAGGAAAGAAIGARRSTGGSVAGAALGATAGLVTLGIFNRLGQWIAA